MLDTGFRARGDECGGFSFLSWSGELCPPMRGSSCVEVALEMRLNFHKRVLQAACGCRLW